MKKLLVIAILVVLVSTSAFAALLQLGPAATINLDATKVDASTLDVVKDVNNWAVGAEARVNLAFLQVGAYGGLTFPTDGYKIWTVNSILSANAVLGPKLINGSIGIAVPYTFFFGEGAPEFSSDLLLNTPICLKAGLNANLSFIGLGVSYYIPTGVSFKNFDKPELAFDQGLLTVAAFFNIL